MILWHVVRPHAEDDIDAQVDYYEQQAGIEVASRFLLSLKEGIAFLYKTPFAGAPLLSRSGRLRELRSWPVPDFEDTRIYYILPEDQSIRIIRVLHGKRNVKRILVKEDLNTL